MWPDYTKIFIYQYEAILYRNFAAGAAAMGAPERHIWHTIFSLDLRAFYRRKKHAGIIEQPRGKGRYARQPAGDMPPIYAYFHGGLIFIFHIDGHHFGGTLLLWRREACLLFIDEKKLPSARQWPLISRFSVGDVFCRHEARPGHTYADDDTRLRGFTRMSAYFDKSHHADDYFN